MFRYEAFHFLCDFPEHSHQRTESAEIGRTVKRFLLSTVDQLIESLSPDSGELGANIFVTKRYLFQTLAVIPYKVQIRLIKNTIQIVLPVREMSFSLNIQHHNAKYSLLY